MNPRISYTRRSRGSLGASASGLLTRAAAIAAGALILVAGLFVSAVVFSVLLVVGLVAGGWLWWKTRHVRRELRERMEAMQHMQADAASGDPLRDAFRAHFRDGAFDPSHRGGRGNGDVIDGDYIRDPERPSNPSEAR